jgi:hypothetical protein
MTQVERAQFYTWCSYMVDLREAREWLDEYLAPRGIDSHKIPDKWLNPSVCYRARLMTLGVNFTKEQKNHLDASLYPMLTRQVEEDEVVESLKPTIRERVLDKASDVIGELEGMLDDGIPDDFAIEAWYRERSVSPTVARMVVAKLLPVLLELDDAIEGDDPQLIEGYRHMTMGALKDLRETYFQVIDKTQRLIDNEKKAKTPRKPKPVSVEKKLKHFVYLPYSKEFNVNSIQPDKIIGAQEFWTLNVRYKMLTVYRAESHGGQLDVERSKVTGFNRNDSHTYRLGRKASALIDAALNGSRAGLKKVITGLKEAPLQERVNENTILLRRF